MPTQPMLRHLTRCCFVFCQENDNTCTQSTVKFVTCTKCGSCVGSRRCEAVDTSFSGNDIDCNTGVSCTGEVVGIVFGVLGGAVLCCCIVACCIVASRANQGKRQPLLCWTEEDDK